MISYHHVFQAANFVPGGAPFPSGPRQRQDLHRRRTSGHPDGPATPRRGAALAPDPRRLSGRQGTARPKSEGRGLWKRWKMVG